MSTAALQLPKVDTNLVILAGLGLGGLLVLGYVIAKASPKAGESVGKNVAGAAAGVAVGVVKGIGEAVGLPDPGNAQTRAEGRAALARGDYVEASRKLPAGEFLNSVLGKLSPARVVGQALGLGRDAVDAGTYVGDLPIDPNAGARAPERALGIDEYYGY